MSDLEELFEMTFDPEALDDILQEETGCRFGEEDCRHEDCK